MSKLAIIGTMKLVPGTREEFVRHLAQHRLRCLAGEPDTHVFEILLPKDDPDTVLLYEVYTDQAGFDAHLSGASIEIMRRDTPGMLLSLTGIKCELNPVVHCGDE